MRAAVALAVTLGAGLVAFFLVFASVFSDGPGDPLHLEYLTIYGLILAATFVLAAAGAHWGGGRWASWALLVATPSFVVLALYASREPDILPIATLDAVAVLVGAAAGAWFAASPYCPLPRR